MINPFPRSPTKSGPGTFARTLRCCSPAHQPPYSLPPPRPFGYLAPPGSFIPTAPGWLYLAVIMDLCPRKIVGWTLADPLRSEIVTEALQQALRTRRGAPNAIFHSDRGSQYGSAPYRQLLSQAGMRQSMSARAHPYHNWTGFG